MDNRKIIHMVPKYYSLLHQSQGVPLSSMKPPLYHLEVTEKEEKGPLIGEGGILGTRMTAGQRGQNEPTQKGRAQADSDNLVTEALLLRLTECETLSEIRVISLRNQQLTSCLKTLSKCEHLTIAYLQGNFLNDKDMMYLQSF
jgi:hypothetical protein